MFYCVVYYSPSGQLIASCEERRAVAILSRPVIDEYRRVLSHLIERDAAITQFQIESLLRKLRYFGDYLRIGNATFSFSCDPTDAKLIELAIDGGTTHILSYDRDLLSLPRSRGDAGKRFRQRLKGVAVLTPQLLILQNPQLLPQ